MNQIGYAIMKMNRLGDSIYVCMARTSQNADKRIQRLESKTHKVHWKIPLMKSGNYSSGDVTQ